MNEYVGNTTMYKIYDLFIRNDFSKSNIIDPERGAIINKKIHSETKIEHLTSIDFNSGGSSFR